MSMELMVESLDEQVKEVISEFTVKQVTGGMNVINCGINTKTCGATPKVYSFHNHQAKSSLISYLK